MDIEVWLYGNTNLYEEAKHIVDFGKEFPDITTELRKGNFVPLELFCKLQGYNLMLTEAQTEKRNNYARDKAAFNN